MMDRRDRWGCFWLLVAAAVIAGCVMGYLARTPKFEV